MSDNLTVDVIEPDVISELASKHGNSLKRSDIVKYCKDNNYPESLIYSILEKYKVSRAKWNLIPVKTTTFETTIAMSNPSTVPVIDKHVQESADHCLIPERDKNYVPFGNFTDVKKIINSRCFYPVFITGLSGNGKTFSIEQACAALKREIVRVNITVETDEDDLIGGFRLKDGDTVWHDGPVVEAMKRGAILLLDELDLASNKIMCLQSILEGKGVFLKKINKLITPAPGFNIFATANTKGKGSDDGRFIGTNILNEAFLERFGLTFEQDYPSPSVEFNILQKLAKDLGILNADWSKRHTPESVENYLRSLCGWAQQIRKTFNEGGVDEVISTRRLVHIVRAFAIFGNKSKAMAVCLNRFDEDTNKAFMSLYTSIVPEEVIVPKPDDTTEDDEVMQNTTTSSGSPVVNWSTNSNHTIATPTKKTSNSNSVTMHVLSSDTLF